MAQVCEGCGQKFGWNDAMTTGPLGRDYHPRCVPARDEWEEPDVRLTTTPNLEGWRVSETLDVVTAECAFGMNLFRDMFAGMSDTFGGRSQATQKVLRDARKTVLTELKHEAARIDASAVLGVRLDYSEISGKGKSMLFVVASGTAVKAERTTEPEGPPS